MNAGYGWIHSQFSYGRSFQTRCERVFWKRTHLRAIGCSLHDAVDKRRAVALGKDAFRIESQVSRHRDRHRIYPHLGRDSQRVRIFIIAPCEFVGADRVEVRQNICRFEIPIADSRLSHGYLGRICSYPLSKIALFDFEID